MRWYDSIARLYDYFSIRPYRKPRKELIERMDLKPGDNVLCVGCGTGLIFRFIKNKIGTSGIIIGLDASKNMLQQARYKIEKRDWNNIHLIHADARDLSSDLVAKHTGKDFVFDHVIGELSFSVMPDWQLIMKHSISLLKETGKLGILDGHRAKQDWINKALNALPRSDISRPISDYAKSLTENYVSKTFGMTKIVFIGIGQKP